MSSIDPGRLFDAMLGAMRGSLVSDANEAQKFLQSSSRTLAANTKEVADWLVTGDVTLEEAQALMRMHARSAKMVLTAAETIGLAMAERAINAALSAVRDLVNGAIGLPLL